MINDLLALEDALTLNIWMRCISAALITPCVILLVRTFFHLPSYVMRTWPTYAVMCFILAIGFAIFKTSDDLLAAYWNTPKNMALQFPDPTIWDLLANAHIGFPFGIGVILVLIGLFTSGKDWIGNMRTRKVLIR
jgi:hypothetical protein